MKRLGKKAFKKSMAAVIITAICCSCLLAACTVDYDRLNKGLYDIGKGLYYGSSGSQTSGDSDKSEDKTAPEETPADIELLTEIRDLLKK